ncbi:hypothetical protein C8F01DRAFT_267320 [Mycena amicta]|nr:hypothetical protein C8F01DRAFT_267320 [Mycena amicta]
MPRSLVRLLPRVDICIIPKPEPQAYIDSNIRSHPNNLFKNRVPPLDIILFAVNKLLARIDHGHIPDLLDLLTTVEFFRKLALQKANEALALHLRYVTADPRKTSLTPDEEAQLRAHQENDQDLRSVYLELYHHLSGYHIYHLWTSDPPRAADTVFRLCEYYPELIKNYPQAQDRSPRLFYNDLSAHERDECIQTGTDICSFITNSCEWVRAHYPKVSPIHSVFQQPDFQAAFPCVFQLEDIRKSIDYYTKTVEAMVTELQDMFPPDAPSPTKGKSIKRTAPT